VLQARAVALTTPENRRLAILGPPGSGKGTCAKRLAEQLGVPHIASGDMLRHEVLERTDIGRQARRFMDAGELVPDEVVVEMTVKRVSAPDARRGWILDGFPRTLEQAHGLDRSLEERGPSMVLLLQIRDDEVIERIGGRRVCPDGHAYHVTRKPPRASGVCDVDGKPLQHRDDDTPEVIRHRLEVYKAESGPMLELYSARGIVKRVDGTGGVDEVYERACAAVFSTA
jgi:adenylate kinase